MDSIVVPSQPDATPWAYTLTGVGPEPDAWEALDFFTCGEFVLAALRQLHREGASGGLSLEDRSDIVTHSVRQAKEYFKAAADSSLHTSPELLYYGAMSLAAATIAFRTPAFKKFGKAHGLAPYGMHSSPMVMESQCRMTGSGTFPDLARLSWRDMVRMPSKVVRLQAGAADVTDSFELRFCARPDWHLPYARGESRFRLADLLGEVPDMWSAIDTLASNHRHLMSAPTHIIRFEGKGFEGKPPMVLLYLVDYSRPDEVERAATAASAEWSGSEVSRADGGSFGVSATFEAEHLLRMPPLRQASDHRIFFSAFGSHRLVPELCCYYVAAYMLSMTSRYQPLEWGREVTSCGPSSILIGRFVTCAIERLPLLFVREIWDRWVGREA